MAETFIPNPKNLPEVDHIDNNKENNDISNLRWISSFDNKSRILFETRSKCRICLLYTSEICRWSRQPLANKFMDWVWDIVEKYRSKEILDFTCVTHTLNQLMNVFQKYENQICKIEKQLAVQQKQLNRLTTHKKPYNPWFSKMSPKYKLLEEHFNITRGELYKEILMELKKTYGLDPNQIQVDGCV